MRCVRLRGTACSGQHATCMNARGHQCSRPELPPTPSGIGHGHCWCRELRAAVPMRLASADHSQALGRRISEPCTALALRWVGSMRPVVLSWAVMQGSTHCWSSSACSCAAAAVAGTSAKGVCCAGMVSFTLGAPAFSCVPAQPSGYQHVMLSCRKQRSRHEARLGLPILESSQGSTDMLHHSCRSSGVWQSMAQIVHGLVCIKLDALLRA